MSIEDEQSRIISESIKVNRAEIPKTLDEAAEVEQKYSQSLKQGKRLLGQQPNPFLVWRRYFISKEIKSLIAFDDFLTDLRRDNTGKEKQ